MHRPPFRLYIGISLFLCTSVTFMYRTCFTLVLRDMVQPLSAKLHADSNSPKHCHSIEVKRYDWTADQQIYLISAYFIGYIITNLFGGVLAERFGATKTISLILVLTAASFATIPKISTFGYYPLFALRIVQGCIEGPIYPSIQHIIAYWAPPSEKGRFISVFAGSSFGSMVGHGIVGGLTGHNLGWSSSFYCTAVIGALVWLYWMWIVTDRPDLHIRVTDKEKAHIESAIGTLVNRETKQIPLWAILKSGAVWALVLLNFSASFVNNFQLNSLPTYYNEVLGFPIPEIATIFAVSALIRFGTGLSFSYLGDVLVKKDLMGLTTQRKFFCIFSHIIPGVILISMCYLTSHAVYSACLDVLNTAIMGAINLTVNQNSQDLSPNFASSIYGIVNFTGSIGGFVTLYILALFLNESPVNAWIYMFILTAVVLFLSTAVFLVCGTGKIQPWNEPPAALPKTDETCNQRDAKISEIANY